MAGLTEVYTGTGADASERRLALGAGLFAVGVALAALGALLGTTEWLAALGYGIYESRRIAGVLAGFGVPAAFLGIVTVLPAARRVRAAAVAGATLASCGVLWFWTAYPADWAGYGRDLTLPVVACYLLGTAVTVACLFVAVARFKTRNDPGGPSRSTSSGGERPGSSRSNAPSASAASASSARPRFPPPGSRRRNPAATAGRRRRRRGRRSTATTATAATSTTPAPRTEYTRPVGATSACSSRWTRVRRGGPTPPGARPNGVRRMQIARESKLWLNLGRNFV